MKIYGRAPAKGEVTLFVLPRTGNVVNYEILGHVLEAATREEQASRAGWSKVKDSGWYARESWRSDRRGAS